MHLPNIVRTLYKIFFIGLLLQFFVFARVTFGIGHTLPARFWLWKEGIVALLLIGGFLRITLKKGLRAFFFPKPFSTLQWTLFVLTGLMVAIDIGIYHQSIGTLFTAFKYDLMGFVIFFVAFHSSDMITDHEKEDLMRWYMRCIKYMLLLALVRYMVIVIKPGTLKFFGYDNFVFEGTVGSPPPAVYYNHINQGIVRNQFLFERPISRGFFLTAFWPLFFFLCLYKQPLRYTWVWRSVYMINVLLTFSRAARGAIVIQSILIGLLLFWQQRRAFFMRTIVPGILVLLALLYGGFGSLLQRGFSDTGHFSMLAQSREMITSSPRIGLGGASVGPGSHHGGTAFNPENQFLQIWLEYGIGGLILWMTIFGGLIRSGYTLWKKDNHTLTTVTHSAWMGITLGLFGLGVSGFVLHSFSDRMIVYPFMLLAGIIAHLTFSATKTGKTNKTK